MTAIFTEPRPPTDLQASNILPTTATITWQTPPPNRMTPWGIVINYEIILTEYAFGLANFVANTTAQSYTLTSLEEFNNYTVVVAAENTVGRGGYSVRFNFSTPQAGMSAQKFLTDCCFYFNMFCSSYSPSSQPHCQSGGCHTHSGYAELATTCSYPHQWHYQPLCCEGERGLHWESVHTQGRRSHHSSWTTASILYL